MENKNGKVVVLTRGFILRSIRKEANLAWGASWISGDYWKAKKDCPSCAVGTVIRHALSRSASVDNIARVSADSADTYSCALSISGRRYQTIAELFAAAAPSAAKYPMATLSHVFESLSMMASKEVVRRETLNFVRAYFPKKIAVNINGFNAAKDVGVQVLTKKGLIAAANAGLRLANGEALLAAE